MRKSIPATMIIFIIISIFIYIWQQSTSTRLAYKVSNLQVKYDKINAENDLLRLKINSILALEKMHRIAKEKNLECPDEKSIVYID
jgi:cell division protein FtsL